MGEILFWIWVLFMAMFVAAVPWLLETLKERKERKEFNQMLALERSDHSRTINAAPQGATGQQTIPKGPALPELPAASAPTPRTDEAHRWICAETDDPVARYRLCLDFARQLERENAQVKADIVGAVQRMEDVERELADMTAARDRTVALLHNAIEENTKLRGAVSTIQQREERRVYKADADEWQSYLNARFKKANSGYRFRWLDHEWRYEHSDFDERGDFDLLIGAATVSAR